MIEPVTEKVRARDVKPYHYGIWCTVGGGQPFNNVICGVRWSDDGARLWFNLESYNSYDVDPDEEIELIPLTHHLKERYSSWTLPPKPVVKKCAHCGSTLG